MVWTYGHDSSGTVTVNYRITETPEITGGGCPDLRDRDIVLTGINGHQRDSDNEGGPGD